MYERHDRPVAAHALVVQSTFDVCGHDGLHSGYTAADCRQSRLIELANKVEFYSKSTTG